MSQLPKFLCGGIDAGEWPSMSGKSVAKALYKSRCNNSVLEAMAPCYSPTGFNDKNLDQIYKELSKFIKPILCLDELWVTLHLTNGNDDNILNRFGWQQVCDKIVKKLTIDFGPQSKIIICPVAETHNHDNENKLINYCFENWMSKGGHLMFNGTGRPYTLPPGYSLLDYHSQNLEGDLGPQIGKMSLLDTDCSPAISWLRYGAPIGQYWNPDRVYDLAIRARNRGNGLNLYSSKSNSTNEKALIVMGNVYNVRKKPNWFKRLLMEIKLLKY